MDIVEGEDDVLLADYIHSKTIEIDGKQVYKATIVKDMGSNAVLSKDRLRRVQGLTKDTGQGPPESSNDVVDNMLYVGDPVFIKPQSGDMYIGNIKEIKIANKVENVVCSSMLGQESTIALEVHKINLVANPNNPDRLHWDGTRSDSSENLSGKYVLAIKPDIDLNPPDNLTMYTFEKQLLLDIGVQMQREPVGEDVNLMLKKCTKCNNSIPLEKMCAHIRHHILNGHLSGANIYGYCGGTSCDNRLKKTRLVKKDQPTIL